MLKTHKYWVYTPGINVSAYTTSADLLKINQRAYKHDGGLMIHRRAGDTDFTSSGLNARFELVPGLRVAWNTPIHLYARVRFVESAFSSTFLQIMGKDNSNNTKPALVMDVHGGNVNVRYKNHSNDSLVRFPIMKYSDAYNKTFDIDVFYKPDKTSNGLVQVFVNGKSVFTRKAQNYWSSSTGNLQFQYGAYGTDGSTNEEKILFYQYRLAKAELPFAPYKRVDIVPIQPTPLPPQPIPLPIPVQPIPLPIPVQPIPLPIPVQPIPLPPQPTIKTIEYSLSSIDSLEYRNGKILIIFK